MTFQAAKVQDPMYSFDTHFPERLSRLHLNEDFNLAGPYRKRKTRAQRSGARYKTQPVTFDEIKEVDEEATPTPDKIDTGTEQVRGQFQTFSRSMDGLLPQVDISEHLQQPASQVFTCRSSSSKVQRHPKCILERVDFEQRQPSKTQPTQNMPHQGLAGCIKAPRST